ncbi:MAG: DinB family protein, partial [Bacteroidota bacterium]|nr:DinB family protein [Bacteroidota bacterium]
MSNPFERLKKVRQSVIDVVKDLSIESVNKIPVGFNNNIAWNLGHLVAAQNGVCYLRAG